MTVDSHIYDPIQEDLMCYANSERIFKEHKLSRYHRHNAYEIYFFEEGDVNVYVEHTRYHMQYGDVIIFSPDELHRNEQLNNGHYKSVGINIKPEYIATLSTPNTNLLQCFKGHHSTKRNNLIHLQPDQVNRLISLVKTIQPKLDHLDKFGEDIIVRSKVGELLVELYTLLEDGQSETPDTMPTQVRETMRYIKDNLSTNITLDDIALDLNYSGPYLSNLFKQETGLTIREYILDQRILLAQSLLADGSSVQDATIAAGFNDYSNFIRSFKKATGMPPGKFRRESI